MVMTGRTEKSSLRTACLSSSESGGPCSEGCEEFEKSSTFEAGKLLLSGLEMPMRRSWRMVDTVEGKFSEPRWSDWLIKEKGPGLRRRGRESLCLG